MRVNRGSNKNKTLELPSSVLDQINHDSFNSKEWSKSHNIGTRKQSRKVLRKEARQAKKHSNGRHNNENSRDPAPVAPIAPKRTRIEKSSPKPKKKPKFDPNQLLVSSSDRALIEKEEAEARYYAKKLGLKTLQSDGKGEFDDLLEGLEFDDYGKDSDENDFPDLDGIEASDGEIVSNLDEESESEEESEGETMTAAETMAKLAALKAAKASKSDHDTIEKDIKSEVSENSEAEQLDNPWTDDSLDGSDFDSEDDNAGKMTAEETMAALAAAKKRKNVEKSNTRTVPTDDSEMNSESANDNNTDSGSDSDSDSDSDSGSSLYKPPVKTSGTKYVPPSRRRDAQEAEDDNIIKLRRKVNGALNRLAEANMVTIINELQDIFQQNSHNLVTEILTQLILDGIKDGGVLQESFLTVRAAVIAALYKTIGINFAASFVELLITEFENIYKSSAHDADANVTLMSNMLSLLIECYSFKVVSTSLMYELVRQFLDEIGSTENTTVEMSTELLLLVIRQCGSQLRTENPLALKEIIVLLQQKLSGRDASDLGARTSFLVQSIVELKNNRSQPVSELLLASRHRIRKMLGGLPDPLQVSLTDILDADKKGKWWLVGAAWRGHDSKQDNDYDQAEVDAILDSAEPNWLELAKAQRLNTDVRRAIFTALMGAEDYLDACQRIDKLRLKSKQEREVPHVIIHCCGMEESYNPYYSLVAGKQCDTYQAKRTLRYRLGDYLAELQDSDSSSDTRRTMHLARFFASLVVQGVMSLDILAPANFLTATGDLKVFLEVFMAYIYKTLGKQAEAGQKRGMDGEITRNGRELTQMLARTKDKAVLRGIQYIHPAVLSNGMVSDAKSKQRVAWCIDLASELINQLAQKEDM